MPKQCLPSSTEPCSFFLKEKCAHGVQLGYGALLLRACAVPETTVGSWCFSKKSGMVSCRGGRCKLSCLRRAGSLRAVSPVTANSFSGQFLLRLLLSCWFAKQPLLLFPYFRKFRFFQWCHFGDAVWLHPVFFESCSLRVSSCKKMWIKKHVEMHLSTLLTLLNLLVSSMFSFSSTLSLLSPRQL